MQLKHPEQRGMGGQVEIRNNIKIQIPACHANMVRAEHRSSNKRIRSGTILNAPKGIAAGQMTKSFRELIQYLQGLGMF